jgi:hypothetical protein
MMPSDKKVGLPKNSTIGCPVSMVAKNCSTVMDQCGSGPRPGFPFRSGDCSVETLLYQNKYIIQGSKEGRATFEGLRSTLYTWKTELIKVTL